MSVTTGPKKGLMISAADGDTYGVQCRALLRALDTMLFPYVIDHTLSAPPGSPTNGQAYIVATSPSGAWSGQAGAIAVWSTDNPAAPSGEWEFYAPEHGWVCFSRNGDVQLQWSGSAWVTVASLLSGIPESSVTGLVSDLAATEKTANKGAASGYASLDGSTLVPVAQIPSLPASQITSGQLALARGGTNADLSATGGTTKILRQNASHVVSAGDLVAGDIPDLSASYDPVSAASMDVNPAFLLYADDFLDGASQNRWSRGSIGAAPVAIGVVSVKPNYGIQQIGTNAAPSAGQGVNWAMTAGGSSNSYDLPSLSTTTGWKVTWIFKLTQTNDTRMRIGVTVSNAGVVQPSDGIWLRYDTNASFADTNFIFATRVSSGTENVVDSGIAADTNWHKIEFSSSVLGTVHYKLYDAAGALQASGDIATMPTTALTPTADLCTDSSTQKLMQLDYFSMFLAGIAR